VSGVDSCESSSVETSYNKPSVDAKLNDHSTDADNSVGVLREATEEAESLVAAEDLPDAPAPQEASWRDFLGLESGN